MSVDINPQELGFHRPFTVEVVENLKIKNPNSLPIAFKVKTTAPKQYAFLRNDDSNYKEPAELLTSHVQILRQTQLRPRRTEQRGRIILQAMKQEPPPNTKCRDKFLVQSVAITPDKDFTNLAHIWDSIDRSHVQEKKIRVSFLDTEGAAVVTPVKNMSSTTVDATPDISGSAFLSPSEPDAPQSELKSSVEKSPSDFATSGAAFATPAAAVAVTKNSEPTREELKQQLLQAEELIAQLKKDNGGLRQRKATAATEEKPATAPAPLAQETRVVTEGVPIQIAAVLCFVSFLLAYIFF
ncbi:PapD-like protein [Xylaria sp. CBS 124048]|nr:PapD-like protein [Xylaria sp. CBS 124048]